ncbi:TPA: hypothetical protein ACH3X1_012392 [Trebouxia sp. C0004]
MSAPSLYLSVGPLKKGLQPQAFRHSVGRQASLCFQMLRSKVLVQPDLQISEAFGGLGGCMLGSHRKQLHQNSTGLALVLPPFAQPESCSDHCQLRTALACDAPALPEY